MTITEALVHALLVRSKAVEVEVLAMQAHDKGSDTPYAEVEYLACSRELYSIQEQIDHLARTGEFTC